MIHVPVMEIIKMNLGILGLLDFKSAGVKASN